jgi:ribosomal peptide maturation radical SAM protein 1
MAARRRRPPGDGLGVALVSMPFGALERPPLGLGLLQAEAGRAGHRCSSHFFGFALADEIGVAAYHWVSHELPYTMFAGEWLFAPSLHGPDPVRDERYLDEVARRVWHLDDGSIDRLLRIRERIPAVLDRCLAEPFWRDVDVVGFTSTFQQNVASLALARRVREHFPSITIVMGGANWEHPMGLALHERCPAVDVVVSGEADRTWPDLLAHLASGLPLDDLPGIVVRGEDGRSQWTGAPALIDDLDALPHPVFDDFLDAFAASSASELLSVTPLIETSRGCWWGAHSHCTFCGLNGGTMAFRSKSPDRAFEELRDVVDRFGDARIGFVDNILDMRYFRTFLPRVAEELPGLSMFYEVKASLTNRQVAQLAASGVHEVQPGIESLSDHVLELLRKGTTTLRNVQLLKWCAEHGVKADWNILYGAPGETSDDHASMIRVIDAIDHLEPPTACGPIRIDRFSPYHDDPAGFGITGLAPMAPYRFIHPWSDEVLERIAYYFDLPASDVVEVERRARPLRMRVDRWQHGWRGELRQIVSEPDQVVVVDTRGPAMVRHELTAWRAAIYLACDAATDLAELARLPEVHGVPAAEVIAFLDQATRDHLILVQHRHALALAVRTPAREHAAEERPRTGRRLALLGVA